MLQTILRFVSAHLLKNEWFEFGEYGEIVKFGSGFYFRRLKNPAMKGIKMPGMCEWSAAISMWSEYLHFDRKLRLQLICLGLLNYLPRCLAFL